MQKGIKNFLFAICVLFLIVLLVSKVDASGQKNMPRDTTKIYEYISSLDGLLPQSGALAIKFEGDLKRMIANSPTFADSIVQKLQKHLPENIKLVVGDKIKSQLLGTIKMDATAEKRSFKKMTDAKEKYSFLEKSIPVKFYKLYSLELEVKMNPIKSKIYKIWRTTNWDDLVVGKIVPLDRKSFEKPGPVLFDQLQWFHSSFWQKIAPFKFTGFNMQQYLYFQP